MTEVAAVEAAEPQVDDASPESVETPATPQFDEATWRKKLAGKDQALTASQSARAQAEQERDELRRWKAEREQADLSELDKAIKRAEEAEAKAAAAVAVATAATLARDYPLAAEALGDDLAALSVERIAELNARLAKESGDESEPEPRIDPNNPRRPVPKPPPNDLKSLKDQLTALGNPFFDPDA